MNNSTYDLDFHHVEGQQDRSVGYPGGLRHLTSREPSDHSLHRRFWSDGIRVFNDLRISVRGLFFCRKQRGDHHSLFRHSLLWKYSYTYIISDFRSTALV